MLPPRLLQHVLNEDAVPLGGLVDHHMGHRAHQLPVLKDGAAAHPLDDAAGLLDQRGVRHLDQQVLYPGAAQDPDDLDGVGLHPVAADVGEDGRGPGVDLPGSGHRQRVALRIGAGLHGPEDPLLRIGVQLPQIVGQVEAALQFAGRTGAAPLHRLHRGPHHRSVPQGHQKPRVRIRDAVPQRAEGAGGGVIKSYRADARHAVPDPGPQPPGAVGAQHRLGGQFQFPAVPGHVQVHPVSALEQGGELLGALHLLAVGRLDHVSHLQSALRAGGEHAGAGLHLRQADDHHALGKQLDADGVPHGDQPVRLQRGGLGGRSGQGGGAQQPAKKKSRGPPPSAIQSSHPFHHPFQKFRREIHSHANLRFFGRNTQSGGL